MAVLASPVDSAVNAWDREIHTVPAQPNSPTEEPMTRGEGAPFDTQPEWPSEPVGATDPGDLTLPLYGATFGQAVSRFYGSYARFSGRASRSEFWWVMLALKVVAFLCGASSVLGTLGPQAPRRQSVRVDVASNRVALRRDRDPNRLRPTALQAARGTFRPPVRTVIPTPVGAVSMRR